MLLHRFFFVGLLASWLAGCRLHRVCLCGSAHSSDGSAHGSDADSAAAHAGKAVARGGGRC